MFKQYKNKRIFGLTKRFASDKVNELLDKKANNESYIHFLKKDFAVWAPATTVLIVGNGLSLAYADNFLHFGVSVIGEWISLTLGYECIKIYSDIKECKRENMQMDVEISELVK